MIIKKGVDRESYIWNAIAGLINASEAVVILMVITRTNGLMDAGIVTIGFSIANLFVTVGKFGIRNLQVTDTEEKYEFSTYFRMRIVTTFLMVISICVYLIYCKIFNGYSGRKIYVVFLICSIYVFESVEDVFWGRYQQEGRLDIGAKIFSCRWVLTILSFILSALLTKDLLLTASAGCVVCMVSGIVLINKTKQPFIQENGDQSIRAVKELFIQSFPLFTASFLSFYIINAPKYAIDKYLSEEVQACYGFVAMPVFVIGLLNGFIYQPTLVKMSIERQTGQWKIFVRRIKRQILIIIGITVVCIGGAYFCGIPVLSWIYGTDLKQYKAELLILLLGGGMQAFVGYMTVIITILRKQIYLSFGYFLDSILALVITGSCVKRGGALGGAISYFVLISILACIFGILSFFRIKREMKTEI